MDEGSTNDGDLSGDFEDGVQRRNVAFYAYFTVKSFFEVIIAQYNYSVLEDKP